MQINDLKWLLNKDKIHQENVKKSLFFLFWREEWKYFLFNTTILSIFLKHINNKVVNTTDHTQLKGT